MKISGQHKKAVAVISTVATALFLFASLSSTLAGSEKYRVAIVHLKGIKPYQSLNDGITRRLYNRVQIRTFEVDSKTGTEHIRQELMSFEPAVIVCIGNMAYQVCSTLDIAALVLVYNTKLLAGQNPFCTLRYLQPTVKKAVTVVDKNATTRQRDFIIDLAAQYDLDLSVTKAEPHSRKELLYGNDTIFLSRGVLIINPGLKKRLPQNGYIVAVVERGVEAYRQLEQNCVSELPEIDEIIDISILEDDVLREKLTKANPAVIICIGANSYQRCKFMQDDCKVLIAIKTRTMDSDISRWGWSCGVNMFVEPKVQIDVLSLLVKHPVTLAIPYDPKNTELLVLKALLETQSDITLVPLPVSASSRISKVITKALGNYDGVWVVPDQTISVAPIQKLLLEESLKERKMLVTMMHPYTKRGAAMAASSTGKDDAGLCDKVVELINEHLDRPGCAGRIASPPVYISLNVRTLKRLNYKVPESLLNQAEYVFGRE